MRLDIDPETLVRQVAQSHGVLSIRSSTSCPVDFAQARWVRNQVTASSTTSWTYWGWS